jgi:acylphosphatase
MALSCAWLAEGYILPGITGSWKWSPVNTVKRRRMQAWYSGTVQGVGFRYTVKALTTGFEVTGTVGNLPDGRVELVAEGTQAELDAFAQAIRESELGHFIRDEQIRWGEADNKFRGFEIVR